MPIRAISLFCGVALAAVLPGSAQAQSEPNVYERLSDGFEAIWDEAGEDGLKFEERPVDMSRFLVVTPTAWTERSPSEIEQFRENAPPPVEGVEYGNDRLRNWLDWLDLEIEAAEEANDRPRLQKAWLDKLFITHSRVRAFTDYGPSSYPYQRAVRGYIAALTPSPDISGLSFRQLVSMSEEQTAELRRAAFDAAPPHQLEDLEVALRHYLSIIANEEIAGPPIEGDALQDSGANQVKTLASVLEYRGETSESAAVGELDEAFDYNSKISGFNWLVNYRYQNLRAGNLTVAAEWSYKMIPALAKLVPVDDPRVLRVVLLSAADHFAANLTDKANRILEGAERICGQTASCSILAEEAGAKEGIAMLEAMGANAQATAFRAALGGEDAASNPTLAALARIPVLEEERNACYDQIEVNPENPFILTPAAKQIVARCNAAIGPDIFSAYEEAGNEFGKSEAMKALAEEIADGALATGQPEVAEPYFGRLVTDARQNGQVYADEIALRHAMTLIALRRFDAADLVLREVKQSTEANMAAGLLYSNEYSNRIDGVESLTVDRYLLDLPNAANAFPMAKKRAEDFREFRQSQVGSVFDETNLARIIGYNQTFQEAADASWSLAQATPTRRGEARAVAFAAIQDALADRTSLSLAYAMADKAEFGGDQQVSQLVARRRQLLEVLAPHRGVDADSWNVELPGSTREEIEKRREFEAIAELSREYRAITLTLQQAAPDYFKLIQPAPLSLADAQATLGSDEAALLILPSEFGTHIMAVTADELRWHRSDLNEAEVAAMVRRLLWFSGGNIEATDAEIDAWTADVDGGANGFDRTSAHRLYLELIAPLEDAFSEKRHLFYAGGGSLSSLPLGILVAETPTGNDDDPEALRQTEWFAGEANIVRIPSLQALAFQRRYGREELSTGVDFRGFGDPVLEGEALTRGRGSRGATPEQLATLLTRSDTGPVADVEVLRQLSRLPGTRRELTQMAQAFDADSDALLIGPDATEATFKKADLSNVGVVALATHGLTAGEVGAAEPGLVFTPPVDGTQVDDGYLTASEVAAMRINADWVILSACNTAAGDGSSGSAGLSGLARAFFYAGASNLLASHWPVRDDVAARLTVKTIELSRDDPSMSRAEAFAAAMGELRNDESADGKIVDGFDTTFAHPSAWAPFELIGDAGIRR
ncbi:CHAT domain-containing protein [Erythrobacter sp. HKB08]|uniref:CHAT domain-containing protein n=1 Tax=Erythrobacter sp. HKB08 TaxID=2502843 RepID=UPI001008BF87|nr:CHAT domain-containing protein [Erythrobacter sp. HKB08]